MQKEDARDTARVASLEIHLLGTPAISLNAAAVVGLTSAKAQALLFFLAVTGRSHTRSALAALLWGDLSDTASRGNLRKALQQLRKSLRAYLVVEQDTVALLSGRATWVDVAEFDTVVDEEALDPDRLQRAVDLYRGDFLEGFYVRDAPDFEDWWLTERARLRERMLSSLQALADHHARQGDLAQAVAFVRHLLSIEPWREAAQRSLMTWLALSGQRSAALAQYEVCRRVLAEELAVEPAEETAALYDRIREGELSPVPTPAVVPANVQAVRPAYLDREAPGATSPCEHFVDREAQLRRLTEFLESALAGRGQVAFVEGEAGWGKTRLVAEFSRRAQERHPGLIVASGICTAFTESGDPYLPFREILRTLCADVEQEWVAGRLTREHALRLWNLLPRMLEAVLAHGRHLIGTFLSGTALLQRSAAHEGIDPDLLERLQDLIARRRARPQEAGVDQGRIFEEVGHVLMAVSRERPLLLVLDDLHWADPSSLGLLFHLGRRLAGSHVLILGTYRPEDVASGPDGQTHPLAGILAEFKRLYGDTRVTLGPEESDGRDFVDGLLDSEPNRFSEQFRARLARDTNGYPLFTVEMLRDMEERGDVYRDEGGRWVDSPTIAWNALPRRVEGVIERRVNRLEPRLRGALVTASVEGEEFTAEVVARVRGLQVPEMVGLLSADLDRQHHLVRASGIQRLGEQHISRYHFSHSLFQKYLYQTLDPVERTYLHEAIGSALEAVFEGRSAEIAVLLARHFQEAGRYRKAVQYLKQAGDAAAQVYANTEAIGHYSLAIELADHFQIESVELTALYLGLGRALELDSQFDRVLAAYERMEALALERGNRPMELASLMARATIQSVPTAVHNPERALILGERALSLACELGDQAAEAKILWSLSLANYFTNRLAEAIDCGQRSLALARRLDLREQMAHTLNDLGGFIYLYSGHIDQSIEALQEASELWRDLGNSPMLADSLSGLCIARVYAGEYDRAIALSELAFEISQAIENVWGQSYSRWTIGDAYRARGEYSRALEASETCIRLGESAGFLACQTYTRLKLATIYGDLGAAQRGIQMAKESLEVADKHIRAHAALALGILSHLHVLSGDLGLAERALREAKKEAFQQSWAVFYLPVLSAEAELALSRGDFVRAMAVADELLERLRRYDMRSGLPEALYLGAHALLGLGEEQAAREQFQEACNAAEAVGSRRMLWRSLSSLARLESEPAVAADLRQRSRQVLETMARHIEQEDLQNLFLGQPEVRAVIGEGQAL